MLSIISSCFGKLILSINKQKKLNMQIYELTLHCMNETMLMQQFLTRIQVIII